MSSGIFAVFRPTNLEARVAFSNAAELSRCQPPPLWAQYMHIEPIPIYDAEYAWQCENNATVYDVDSEASITEPETDTDEQRRDTYKLWTGYFVFKLANLEVDPVWYLGKGRWHHQPHDESVQFKMDSPGLRGWHIKFELSEKAGYLAVMPASRAARKVTVGGTPVEGRVFHLNKDAFDIGIADLSFRFAYTDYARSREFDTLRSQFWSRLRNRRLMDSDIAELGLTPMPPKHVLVVGRYVLAKEIGRGSAGKVYSATDDTGAVFAIKMVERNKRSASSVAKEVQVLNELAQEAERADCAHILRLIEVIGDWQSSTSDLLFKDIYFVFETVASHTAESVIQPNTGVPLRMRLRYLRDILLGLQFLHDRDWVHRDVKESNVGIYQGRAVLLDMGCVKRLEPPSMSIAATPGFNGTIGYHAPETEMTGSRYGCGVDVWAAGIVGYALVFLQHPLKISRNPWREGNEALRPSFNARYENMYDKLYYENYGARGVNDLLMQMLRSDELTCNQGARISADGALAHQCWNQLTDNDATPPFKKSREQI
ncbi:hypothetical protein DPSP01_014280 [Paraphaeosphaeria sporulosa]